MPVFFRRFSVVFWGVSHGKAHNFSPEKNWQVVKKMYVPTYVTSIFFPAAPPGNAVARRGQGKTGHGHTKRQQARGSMGVEPVARVPCKRRRIVNNASPGQSGVKLRTLFDYAKVAYSCKPSGL
jgi:hypothetical protein